MNKINISFECTPSEAARITKLIEEMEVVNNQFKTGGIKIKEANINQHISDKTIIGKEIINQGGKRKKYIKTNLWAAKEMAIVENAVMNGATKGLSNNKYLRSRHPAGSIYQKVHHIKKLKEELEKAANVEKENIKKLLTESEDGSSKNITWKLW